MVGAVADLFTKIDIDKLSTYRVSNVRLSVKAPAHTSLISSGKLSLPDTVKSFVLLLVSPNTLKLLF